MNEPFSRRAFLKVIGGGIAGMASTAGSASGMQNDRVTIDMKIGQISFMQMTTAAEKPYGSSDLGSKYRGQTGPRASRYWENF